jgi:hypothetical protein
MAYLNTQHADRVDILRQLRRITEQLTDHRRPHTASCGGIDLLLLRFRRSVRRDRYVTSPSVSSLRAAGFICYYTESAAPDRARL